MRVSGRHQAWSRATHRQRGMGAAPGGTNTNRGRRASDRRRPETYDVEYRITPEQESPSDCNHADEHMRYRIRAEHNMRIPPWVLSAVYHAPNLNSLKGTKVDVHI